MKSARNLALIITCCASGLNAADVFPIATNPALIEFGGQAAVDGTNYLSSLIVGTNLEGQLIAPNGQLIGSPVVVGSNPGFPPAVAMATAKTNSLAAWTDHSLSSGVTMFGRLVSASGVGSSFPLLSAAGGHGVQAVQAAASDGTNFLVIWQDTTTGSYYGQRVSGNGALLGSEFYVFATAGNAQRNMALAFGQTNYLVAWQDGTGNNDQTYCETISLSGAVGSVFQVNTTSSLDKNPAAIGFDGTNYLVIWDCSTNQSSSGWPEWQLRGRLVSPSGVALGNELVLVTEQASFPAMGFDGANYLLAWGYDTTTTNSDQTIHAQFLDRSGNALGPIFTPFSTQGTNPPLLPIEGVLFDGERFLLTATFGSFMISPTGDVMGLASGDVYGRFLPSSTASPVFTNVTVAGGSFQGQLLATPGVTYTIETSTNLPDWTAVDTISSDGSNMIDLLDPRPVANSGCMLYRIAVGNLVPARFTFNFHEFANAGGFGSGYTPMVSYPVGLDSYSANFDVEHDTGLPAATDVYFTGPVGSGLSNQSADPNNSSVGSSSASYQSPFVSSPAAAPGGTWVVNYKGTNDTFNVADPQAASRLVIPLPTVTVSGGVVQSISWTYMDATTGSNLGSAPAYVTQIQVQIEGLVNGRLYNSPWLSPGVTSHTLTSSVDWTNVSMIYMAYDDSLGNHYVVGYTKP